MTLPDPITTPPSTLEIKARLSQVWARMEAAGIDTYVSHDPDNVFYLTNFANFVHERPFVLVLPLGKTPLFVVPQLEQPHVTTRSVGELELVPYFEFPAPEGRQWSDQFKKLFGPNAKVGVESLCPLQVYEEIPGERVRIDIVDEVRMVKSPYEIGRLAHACKLFSQGHEKLLELSKPGTMMVEIYGEVSRLMMTAALMDIPNINMLATSLMGIVLPPSVSHDPHNFTDVLMKMEKGGPHVSGVGSRVNGYGGEVERTFFCGHVPEEAKRPFEVMMEGRRMGFEMTRPGANMGEVDEAINNHFKAAGYGDNLLHRTGHSFGVTAHEAPFLAEGYDRVIEPGMLFSIEPGIYIPGTGGFRHSDTLLVTETGNVSLTHAPETLEELTLEI